MFTKLCAILFLINTVHCSTFTVTSQIYLDIKHNKKPLGRMVIGLFGDYAPQTVANFRHICLHGIEGKTYVGTTFHRVIDRFMIQGGDIVMHDGRGSISIYGKYFPDENLTIEHSGPGFVGMANYGPDTNGCQFYINTIPTPWLNGKHTVFGKVVKGTEVVHKIEKVKTDTDDVPVKPVIITGCGEVPISKPFQITDELYGIWDWIVATGPPLCMQFVILMIFHYFIRKLSMYC